MLFFTATTEIYTLSLHDALPISFYFETRPSPLLKIKENAFDAHFLQLYRKNEYGDPHFSFHDFNKGSASFR